MSCCEYATIGSKHSFSFDFLKPAKVNGIISPNYAVSYPKIRRQFGKHLNLSGKMSGRSFSFIHIPRYLPQQQALILFKKDKFVFQKDKDLF